MFDFFQGCVKFNGTYKDMKHLDLDFLEVDNSNPKNNVVEVKSKKDITFLKQDDFSESTGDDSSNVQKSPCLQIANQEIKPSPGPLKGTLTSSDGNPVPTGVSLKVYWKYFKAGAGPFSFTLFMLNLLIAELLFCASDYWIKLWTEAENTRWLNTSSTLKTNSSATENKSSNEYYKEISDNWYIDRNTGIYVYSIIVVGVFLFGYARAIHFYSISIKASTNLHGAMFNSILRSPVEFFDNNSVGRSDIVFFFFSFFTFILPMVKVKL